MDREEVKALFFEGITEYEHGMPIPTNRVKALGWRHAKFAATQLLLNLDLAYEAFCELNCPVFKEDRQKDSKE